MNGCTLIPLLSLFFNCEGFHVSNRMCLVPQTCSSLPSRTVMFADEDPAKENSGDESYEPQYGVSFIGGDPCGSKYNTDPHDARVEKPGMPDSMKARIDELVAKRKKGEAEKDANQQEQ